MIASIIRNRKVKNFGNPLGKKFTTSHRHDPTQCSNILKIDQQTKTLHSRNHAHSGKFKKFQDESQGMKNEQMQEAKLK